MQVYLFSKNFKEISAHIKAGKILPLEFLHPKARRTSPVKEKCGGESLKVTMNYVTVQQDYLLQPKQLKQFLSISIRSERLQKLKPHILIASFIYFPF